MREWETLAEAAITDSGSLGTWRVVKATEEGREVERYVEVGSRRGKVMVSVNVFYRLFEGVHAFLHPDGKTPDAVLKGQ